MKKITKKKNNIKVIHSSRSDIKDSNKKKKIVEKIDKSKNKNSKNRVKKEKKHKRKLWKRLLTLILILIIIGVLSVSAFLAYVVITAPKFDEAAFETKEQTIIYDINGEVITKLGVGKESQKRESVTYDELPQVLVDAIIATEDSRFYQHNGVDLARFIKAAILQLLGRDEGGASTLTMQVVKNSLTSNISHGIQGIIRKFQDVYLSVFKVEKNYTKEEIIELYVNNYGLGSNVYGVQEASSYYFGKSVSELTLPEAAVIAGLFQAPNGHNPYRNMESAIKRRKTVLNLMVRHGYITQEEADIANSISIESLLVGVSGSENTYQGYIDTVLASVEELTGENPLMVPMQIYTTMERGIQEGIDSVLSNNKWYWKDDAKQAGIAVINVDTGAIAAVGAGRNRVGILTFNYATDAQRQPGSTAKPIFAYGPGFEFANYSTYTLFTDEKWTYTSGPEVNNWDGKFHGLVTTRYALQFSRNIPALKSFQGLGPKTVHSFASNLGFDVALNESSDNYRIVDENTGVDNTINEAYSIGGVSEGFSPLQMAAAYAGFASGGFYTSPYCITKIIYRDTGETIEYKPTKTRVMKDSTAYLINNILESAVEAGFNGGAKVAGSHVAAKTGTSNFPDALMKKYHLPDSAINDLWTIAYTSKYSVAVWVGYDALTEDNVSKGYYGNNVDGSKDAIVSDIMRAIPKDPVGWTAPSSVIPVQVEKESSPAKLPSPYTPAEMITTEYFIRGTQPTEISDRYAQLDDIPTPSVVTTGNVANITWSYETPLVMTEEYIKKYFSQSVFGNSSEQFVEDRIKYNENTFGDLGFGIYEEDSDGTLVLLDFTTDNSYSLKGTGVKNIVIKAEYDKFKANASDGMRLTLTLADPELTATIKGSSSVQTEIGKYVDSGIDTVMYGNVSVKSTAKIKYQLDSFGTVTDYNSKTELENVVNALDSGTYKIYYIVTYDDKKVIKTRIVTLKQGS